MAGLINELIDILYSQANNYDELLVLGKEKRNVIIENNTEMLQKITQAENSIIGRNQRMENKRLAILKDIANVLNRDADELTLSSLAEFISGQAEHSELVKVRGILKDTLDQLKIENDRNAKLLESSIDYINFSINLVRSSLPEESYHSTRKQTPGEEKGFFDAKR